MRGALNDELRYRNATLSEGDYESCRNYLLAVLWRLERRYDPAKGAKTFSTFAYTIVRRRYTSWLREEKGDTRYAYGQIGPIESLNGPEREDTTGALDVAIEFGSIDPTPLSPATRRTHDVIVRAMVFEGLTREQVADALGWPRRQVSNALTEWRDELEERCLAS